MENNCYISSDSEDDYVKEWINDNTIDTITRIFLYPASPYTFLNILNYTHYSWCGPMLLIAEYFAKLSNTKIHLEPFMTKESLIDMLLQTGIKGVPHIVLARLSASHYYHYVLKNNLEDYLYRSTFIGFYPKERILAKTEIGGPSVFQQLKCIERDVYFGIIVSIIVISFVTSLYKQSLKSFFTTFWSYLSVILSDYHSLKMISTFERLLSGLWLIVCTLLLSAFSGQLRDQVIKPKPIQWIDSWEDLHQWKHLTIQTFNISEIKIFCDQYPDHPFSQDFSQRLQVTEDRLTERQQDLFWEYDEEGVKAGRVAIVYGYYLLQTMKRNFISDDFIEDLDFHISLSGDEWEPFFCLSNKVILNHSLALKLDLGIDFLRESGIYERSIEMVLNPQKTGKDIKNNLRVQKIDKISLNHMDGTFIFFVIFTTTSFVVLIMEALTFHRLFYDKTKAALTIMCAKNKPPTISYSDILHQALQNSAKIPTNLPLI